MVAAFAGYHPVITSTTKKLEDVTSKWNNDSAFDVSTGNATLLDVALWCVRQFRNGIEIVEDSKLSVFYHSSNLDKTEAIYNCRGLV